MTDKWSPQEILDIAVRVEKNGQQFYESLERNTAEIRLKETWRYLKEQEVEHQKVFDRMLKKTGEYLVFEFGTGEYNSYLKAIASQYVFTPELIQEKNASSFGSDIEAVDFALDMEKESIFVYTALEDYVIEDKKNILRKIIREEKNHFVMLSGLKKELAGR